jgi:hypothetical protein
MLNKLNSTKVYSFPVSDTALLITTDLFSTSYKKITAALCSYIQPERNWLRVSICYHFCVTRTIIISVFVRNISTLTFEAQTHSMVQLLEMPFQGFSG